MRPIIHAADLHLDCRNPDTSDNGIYLREAEANWMLTALFDLAMSEDAAAIVIAGDVSHFRNPRAWAYVVFRAFLEKCLAVGIEVHVIRGNHDGDDLGRAEFCQAFQGMLHYYRTPQVVDVAGRRILMLPWAGRSTVAAKAGHTMTVAEQNTYMQQALERIIQTHFAEVIVTHFSIAGVRYSSEAQPMLGDSGEFMLSLGMFNTSGLRYVVSGHIHKAQTLTGGPVPVYYPGSAILCDFGQEKEAPMVLIDHGPGEELEERALEYNHLRFVTWNIGENMNAPDVAGSVIRIKGAVPSGDEGSRIVAEMMLEAERFCPAYIAKPVLTLERHEARFTHSITADSTPEDAFAEYVHLVGGEYLEREEALTLLHAEIGREVTRAAIDA